MQGLRHAKGIGFTGKARHSGKMILLFSLFPMIWPWAWLMAALVTLLIGFHRIGMALLGVWGVIALFAGLVSPLAAASVGLALGVAAALPRLHGTAAIAGNGVMIAICIALAAHLVPGFGNIPVLKEVQAGPASSPYTLYLNFDKPLVLALLLLAWPRLTAIEAPLRPFPIALAVFLTLGLFPVARWSGALRPEFTVPDWVFLFLIANLLQTCLVEETFFRGYLQRAAQDRIGPVPAVFLVSVLFGMAHFGGGPALVVFAGMLGLGCGMAFLFSGRLWVPVVLHFGFNTIHLLAFTYPSPL